MNVYERRNYPVISLLKYLSYYITRHKYYGFALMWTSPCYYGSGPTNAHKHYGSVVMWICACYYGSVLLYIGVPMDQFYCGSLLLWISIIVDQCVVLWISMDT
jgi:hypothetical protein